MSVSIAGGFLIVHEQHAVAISHIKRLHLMGRENVDQPTARDVHLAVDLGQHEAQPILGRFRNFREAEAEMLDILRQIDAHSAGDYVAAQIREVSRRLSDVEGQVHDLDQLGPVLGR